MKRIGYVFWEQSMTFTYNPKLLSTSPLMQVRMQIGDTDSSDQMLQDEEIEYALSQRPTILGAAADCCRTLASKFSRQVDSAIGDLRASFSQKFDHYVALSYQLDAKATEQGGGTPYAGGISEADKEQQQEDQDRVPPQYTLGMTDNNLPVPSAGNETLTPKP